MGMINRIRHKVFLSYHHADQEMVDDFIRKFDRERRLLITRVVGGDMATDVGINSNNTEYVMSRIRERYLSDSTVTIVMVGEQTWSSKYVDWEIASSLRQGPVAGLPNGLIGILAPGMFRARLPDRFNDNYSVDSNGNSNGYATFRKYPTSIAELVGIIEDAFRARTSRNNLITNSRLLKQRNSTVGDLGINRELRNDPFRRRRRGL
jgi:hypothetical protein